MSFPVKRGLVAAAVAAMAAGVGVLPAHASDDVSWYITSEVEPGGQVFAKTQNANGGCTPNGPVTSPGLAEPLKWTIGGNFGTYAGYGTAVKKPGKYVASFTCTNGKKTSRSFTVKGTSEPTPTGTPTPTTAKPKPPAPKPKPKPQVVVKPQGAPATGGGYSAA
ncbi:hypothetical protein AB5J62_16900 [Amycolatopsis sp. cg5]|uniref:hypothetical protein n=1 Tax=Amycolatopsis sp. cg5 TaxID=3238802 RepID=UPI003524C3D0